MTIYILQPNRAGGAEAFVVTFMNGTQLLEKVRVLRGKSAVFSLDDPTKPEDADYTYSFVGWNSRDGQESAEAGVLDNIQESKAVYAAYSKTHKPVTVTFMNGQEIWDTVTVPYGGTASTSKGNPTKAEDEQYTYSFAGWASSDGQEAGESGILNNVTSNKTVYAAYSKKAKEDDPVSESPFANTIDKTWGQIIADAEAGNTSGYKAGDIKNLRLTDGGFICYELAGIGVDDLADGSGKAAFTLIAKTIDGKCQWNTSDSNSGGYPSSNYKKYLESTCLNHIPSNIKNAMKSVSKVCRSYSPSTVNMSYTAKIWPPSVHELNYTDDSSYETTGVEYTAYTSHSQRIRYDSSGTAVVAWLSSAYINLESTACYILTSGDWGGYNHNCSNSCGALPCFCLGKIK